MKPLARLVVTLFRLAVIEYQIHSLAITIAGREEYLTYIHNPLRVASMQLLQDIARAEVRRLEHQSECLNDSIANAIQLAN